VAAICEGLPLRLGSDLGRHGPGPTIRDPEGLNAPADFDLPPPLNTTKKRRREPALSIRSSLTPARHRLASPPRSAGLRRSRCRLSR
jgi:hypothetical protein